MGWLDGWHIGAAVVVIAAGCENAPSHADDADDSTEAGGDADDDDDRDDDDDDGDDDDDASAWASVYEEGSDLGMFMSVWGPAPDDLLVVGGQEDAPGSSTAVMLAFDGQTWSTPSLPADTPWLNWVTGIDDEAWAVGRGGTVLRRSDGTWATDPTPTELDLWGVWGTGIDDVWLVGGNPFDGPPALLHYDGTEYEEVATDFLAADVLALFKVWGRSSDEVYVVGDRGAVAVFDGTGWTTRETGEEEAALFAVWGADEGDPIAVGGRSGGRMAVIGPNDAPIVSLEQPALAGVWVDASGTATIVGDLGTIITWSPDDPSALVEQDSGTHHFLHATFGFEGGPRYAVGGTFYGVPPRRGVIVRAD